ncbi:uncharacterized protein LY79DRAFT_573118 [Colletotrichum navitas]|uniref:Tat pathway signal sequence n=1 Tax=Colletotrichum navitas TaxID=681940 RepID=A0AAD8UXI8_9PEZI|nr:uncharacterized protein LY79DRAFT_573118 [Colletotrichum navitas]KAK1565909.1 hypothetical protein LY79DRAFT_573118 [Colletotrichum navitas]
MGSTLTKTFAASMSVQRNVPWAYTPRRTASPLLFLLGLVFMIVATTLQGVVLWKMSERGQEPERLGEINGLFPKVPSKVVQFRNDTHFRPLDLSDPRWNEVMPRGGGFIEVSRSEAKGARLPPEIHTRGMTVYNVAVFHQMHCLHALAGELKHLIDMVRDGAPTGTEVQPSRLEHIEHCLAYLKESLACCGDTALEGQSDISEEPSTDGFGSIHVCKDFGRIFDMAEGRRVSNMPGYPDANSHH